VVGPRNGPQQVQLEKVIMFLTWRANILVV
jgi:hypothetical protein